MSTALLKNGSNTASITSDGELMTTATERERTVFVRTGDFVSSPGTIWRGLIDLSDTTNWPHDETGRIDISTLGFGIDKAGNARGSLSLGVITRVDATDADVAIVLTTSFTENDTNSIFQAFNFSPSQIKCSVDGGKLTRILTNEVATNVTAINTSGGDLSFNSLTFTPAVGDIVLRLISTAAGDLTFGVLAGYHGEATI